MRTLALMMCGVWLFACGSSGRSRTGGDAGARDATTSFDAADGNALLDSRVAECTLSRDCDDEVACTEDRCINGRCESAAVPARCAVGEACDPEQGCVPGTPCARDRDCSDEDACTVNARCNPGSRTCVWELLDGDGDGEPPRVCGGPDCDDSSALVSSEGMEICNLVDEDCDGSVDESADCGGGDCVDGVCTCDSGLTACVDFDTGQPICRDLQTDEGACGDCFRPCPENSLCVAGECQCGGGLTQCGFSCVDLESDPGNCGECRNRCLDSGENCVDGDCICLDSTQLRCGGSCTDVRTSEFHCGSCDSPCPPTAECIGGNCECPVAPLGAETFAAARHNGALRRLWSELRRRRGVHWRPVRGSCSAGAPCQDSRDCAAGHFCGTQQEILLAVQGMPDLPHSIWAGGICTLGSAPPNTPGSCTEAATPCPSCATCITAASTYCAMRCTPDASSRGGCRPGYRCDFERSACLPGCNGNDAVCRIQARDSNNDGVLGGAGDEAEFDPNSTAICDPATDRCTNPGTPGAVAGDACNFDSNCEAEGYCIVEDGGWPNGYCSKQRCDVSGRECAGTTSVCGAVDDSSEDRCLHRCTAGAEEIADQTGVNGHGDTCRPGYRCRWFGTGPMTNAGCVRGNYNDVTTSNYGAACTSHSECYSEFGSGLCLTNWPDGACVRDQCGAPGLPTCGDDAVCVAVDNDPPRCIVECTVSTDCRLGYRCFDTSGPRRVCLPG